jgi:hypothetical protein
MHKLNLQRLAAICGVALALAACGNSGEITRVSEELKLTEEEVRAFRICVRDLTGKKLPVFDIAGKKMRMTSIPVEVCGCASKSIAKAFNGDNIKDAFPTFKGYASRPDKKRVPRIDATFVKDGLDRETVVKTIWDSFTSCTINYQSKYKVATKDLFAAVPPKLTPRQKEEKAKEAAAKKAAEKLAKDKQASVEE